jgi:hypothetical protein
MRILSHSIRRTDEEERESEGKEENGTPGFHEEEGFSKEASQASSEGKSLESRNRCRGAYGSGWHRGRSDRMLLLGGCVRAKPS